MAAISSTSAAHSVLNQLLAAGITDYVISPGSRNAPLTLALARAARAGLINLVVRLDERGAGYYALGLAQAKSRPVVLICTSGTAVANYHPAALEAFHSQIPLIFLTADRPESLWGSGANQTTWQLGILSPIASQNLSPSMSEIDLTLLPAHLNLQLPEPLVDELTESDWWHEPARYQPRALAATKVMAQPRALAIIGFDQAGLSPKEMAEVLAGFNGPIISESAFSSDLALPGAALFLSDPEIRKALAPEQIFIIGRNTLSRSVAALVSNCPNVVVIDPRANQISPQRVANEIVNGLGCITQPDFDIEFLAQWQAASALTQSVLSKEKNLQPDQMNEPNFARVLVKALPSEVNIFIGASRPARDMEAMAGKRSDIRLFHNRGLAGIDGNIATMFGIAQSGRKTFGVIGDLTFLHDLGALVNPPMVDLTIFIIDNNGGGIFSTLPQAGQPGFETVFGTPQNQDIARIISGFGHAVFTLDNFAQLPELMELSGLNFVLVKVPNREQNAQLLTAITQSVVSALRIGSNLA